MNKSVNSTQLKKIIREIGVKVTRQRLIILENILTGDEHVTAQAVYESIRHIAPDIGFATVYRFLRTLCDHKVLTEVRMRGLPARYEWAQKKHHDHLSCVRCKCIYEFENEQIEALQIEIAKKFGFKLTEHILELYGVCSKCQIEQNIPKEVSTPLQTSHVAQL